MTNEEAIEILIRELGEADEKIFPEVLEALNMAIEALQNQPKWILCKEQMPKSKSYHKVLIETKDGKSYVDFAEYIPEKDWWDFSKFNAIRKSNDDISEYSRVVAWTELILPELYRRGESI